jgi:tagaturonate epimerase
MTNLSKFSFGVGDRFAHQAKSQLAAFQRLQRAGVTVAPVWNKSNREHTFIGSHPDSVRAAALVAINTLGWTGAWHTDADHIRLETVDRFIPSCDFFTIDVAEAIGKPAPDDQVAAFIGRHPELIGTLNIPRLSEPLTATRADVENAASKYLLAAQEAARIYRHICAAKGEANVIAEVSMDETDLPQTPPELLIILAALADEKVRVQTIAPKFTGRFNKGVDYVGDLAVFEREFNDDLAVIAHAIARYGLPANLKLSLHSGSDKFSLYPIIRKAMQTTGAGIHIKTAGTNWLEELVGLSEAGGEGLALVKSFYADAMGKIDEFCAPYATVIDINKAKLPSVATVNGWSGQRLANAIRHIQGHPEFDANVRQLLHVSFKLAAKAGDKYLNLLKANEAIVAKNVGDNLYDRHFKPLFLG